MKNFKGLILLLSAVIFPFAVFSAVTSVSITPVGIDGAYLEAGTTVNPVYHMSISADASGDTLSFISIKNTLNSWFQGVASEPQSIAGGTVKLWYSADNNFSDASVAGVFSVDGSGATWTLSPAPLVVSNNSGIFVTVDISSSPVGGTIEMQSNGLSWVSGSVINPLNRPASPAVLQVAQASPASSLLISHANGTMQPYVSTGQENLIPMELTFSNNSAPSSAPVVVTSITITVQTETPYGTILDPAGIISSIRVQDESNGTIYGSSSGAAIPDAATAVIIPISSLIVPAGSSVTTTVYAAVTTSAASSGQNFVLSLVSGSCITAMDYYTSAFVTVSADPADSTGFTMNSNYTTIEPAAVSISAWAVSDIAQNVNKGQQNVTLLEVGFSSPVPANYASAEVNNIKITLNDINSNPLIPANLLSKIYVTSPDGSIIYGSKNASTLETSGDFSSIPLINTIVVPAGSAVTVVVRADISSSTVSNSMKAGIISAQDILARDKNSFSSVVVIPSIQLPFFSNTALLSSSFTVSHVPSMPKNLYKGDAGVKIMDIDLTAPLSFGSGTLLVRGITLTASDSNGTAEDFSSAVSSIRVTALDQDFTTAAPSSGSTFYIVFPRPITVPADAAIYIFPRPDATAKSMQVSLVSAAGLNVYQDNDPLRVISIIAASGDSFPMSSGTGYITGDTSVLTLTNYPNPFRPGEPTKFAYYLDTQSSVTIKIFDLTGRLIRVICDGVPKAPGSHEEDFWDGSGSSGRECLAGTYIVRSEFKSASGSKQTLSRKITLIK